MTIIKSSTKRGSEMLNKARNNEGFSLWVIYNFCSPAKHRAWQWCLDQCHKENGRNFRIISHNTFSFSVAWETDEGTRIETSKNSYLIRH